MTDQKEPLQAIVGEQRRRFLRLAGSAAALLPIAMVTGCGNDAPPPQTAAPAASAPPARPSEPELAPEAPEQVVEAVAEPVPEAAPEPSAPMAADNLPPVDPSEPTAQALAYHHDAAEVDAAQFPQFQPDRLCSNCALYTGTAGQEWGPCGLFPGRSVNANGWCNAWAARRG